jgi:hypothetical protein
VIRQFAAVRVRSAGIAAKVHPNAEVESFHVRRANEARLGASASDTWDRACNPAHGTVPIRPGDVGAAVHFD